MLKKKSEAALSSSFRSHLVCQRDGTMVVPNMKGASLAIKLVLYMVSSYGMEEKSLPKYLL